MTFGITAWGAYIPRPRLERSAIASAHQWVAPSLKGLAKGRRAYCSWDEDIVTMAVEAARNCLRKSSTNLGMTYQIWEEIGLGFLVHNIRFR